MNRKLAYAAMILLAGCEVTLGPPATRNDASGRDAAQTDAGPSASHDAGLVTELDATLLASDAFAPPDAYVTPPDAYVAPTTCTGTATSCSRAVYDRAVAYAAATPLRDGASWSGWCGALMMRFGGFRSSALTAIAAYHASPIASTDFTTAPIGAFHYWSLGDAGHVGVDLLGGGSTVFMASRHLGDSWGTAIGVASVGAYSSASGGRYLGWSMEYNGHGQTLAGGGRCGAATVASGCAVPASTTSETGVPDGAFAMRTQLYARAHGYTGPIDGSLNRATWIGVQRGLAAHGYGGPANGIPATQTYMAFQRVAMANGYTGPVNGVLGPASYRGFARFLNRAY